VRNGICVVIARLTGAVLAQDVIPAPVFTRVNSSGNPEFLNKELDSASSAE